MQNLYELSAADTPAKKWCGGNLGGDNETCLTTVPLVAAVDAFAVGDSKSEGRGHELRMTGAELDAFAIEWARNRSLALWADRPPAHPTGRPPRLTLIGCGEDNTYGHPASRAS
ncbi:hypothetical protein [Streptomyces sp. NPDC060275]|uniref:hypothetical protein n=1 Tax=Streptomyces sp. NPDC060275 TaxID=3347090 RepID=UPI003668D13A